MIWFQYKGPSTFRKTNKKTKIEKQLIIVPEQRSVRWAETYPHIPQSERKGPLPRLMVQNYTASPWISVPESHMLSGTVSWLMLIRGIDVKPFPAGHQGQLTSFAFFSFSWSYHGAEIKPFDLKIPAFTSGNLKWHSFLPYISLLMPFADYWIFFKEIHPGEIHAQTFIFC